MSTKECSFWQTQDGDGKLRELKLTRQQYLSRQAKNPMKMRLVV